MAKRDKKAPVDGSTAATRVTRISADGNSSLKKPPQSKAGLEGGADKPIVSPLRSAGGYFAGAWYELKQVRWPDRRSTWGMTGALIGFTAFFVVFILLLDALFKYLFKLIIG